MKRSPRNKQRILVLAGPTAAGKTAIAHHLAQQHGLAVLSADSMAVYSGMDIGTAKPTACEQKDVCYYGINLVSPNQTYSVGDYLAYVNQCVREPVFIVSGGSGLYIKCLLTGLEPSPPADLGFREEMNRLLHESGVEALQEYALSHAPEAYHQLQDKENPRRIIRALEKARAPEAPPAASETRLDNAVPKLIGLRWERDELGRRIDQRVHKMYADGLLEEAEGLLSRYGELSSTAMQSIGYREAFSVLRGELSREEAICQTVLRSRQFAKRQMTWYNRQFDMQWVDMTAFSELGKTSESVWALWNQFPEFLHE